MTAPVETAARVGARAEHVGFKGGRREGWGRFLVSSVFEDVRRRALAEL